MSLQIREKNVVPYEKVCQKNNDTIMSFFFCQLYAKKIVEFFLSLPVVFKKKMT